MSEKKLKTAEDVRGFIGEAIEAAVGEKLDELKNENQKQIREIRAELAAEKMNEEATEKGLRAARFLRTFAAGGGKMDKALDIATKRGDKTLVKAMEATDATAGGVWVPEELSKEVIELLRPASAVRAMGPRPAPCPCPRSPEARPRPTSVSRRTFPTPRRPPARLP